MFKEQFIRINVGIISVYYVFITEIYKIGAVLKKMVSNKELHVEF